MLVKYTSGKRIYLGKKDAWGTRIKFVAALKSNERVSDKIRTTAGITSSSSLREKYIDKKLKRKHYLADYKRADQHQNRCKVKKLIVAKAVQKNSRDHARHKSGKLSPKEDCKSSVTKQTQKRKPAKPRPCINCKKVHAGRCQEPDFIKQSSGTKKKDELSDAAMDELFTDTLN